MVSRTISFGASEPYGLWHEVQPIFPSGIGWCDGLLICVRCSLWHAKQTWGWSRLSRTASCAAWIWWHEVHETSWAWCVLPIQCERLTSFWWQARQAPLRSAAVVVEALSKVTSGCGRGRALAGLFTCSSLLPWQLV